MNLNKSKNWTEYCIVVNHLQMSLPWWEDIMENFLRMIDGVNQHHFRKTNTFPA